MPTGRVRGYHYRTRKDGTKYRVYSKQGTTVRRTYKSSSANQNLFRRRNPNAMQISGFGKYNMRGNELNIGTDPPSVRNSRLGNFIIRHREYITDVPASVAFTIGSFPLNPGIGVTFPWLSQLAQQFEEWVPRGIIFEFKSMSSDSVVATNANASLGTVIMATEYNSNSPMFGSKQEMENYEWATSCKPSNNMIHTVECLKRENPLGVYYVRNGQVPAGQDGRFYDLGHFDIATQGMQSTGNAVGELWVSYEIEFKKPRINPDLDTLFDHYVLDVALLPGISPARPFGTGGLTNISTGLASTSTLRGTITTTNPSRYAFPLGQGINGKLSIAVGDVFMVQWSQTFTNGGTDGVCTITGTGCNTTSTTPFKGGTSGSTQPIDATTATETETMFAAMVTITQIDPLAGTPTPSFSFTSTSTANTASVPGDFWVISMPNNVN